ncbi:MAG: general secretion pathway protein GspK, partial [Planctomycetes bacterium]|nr:general secretion pathway protein GspK [Planctomycetota bacterium]
MKRNPREEGSALVLALIAAFLLLIVSFEVAHTTRIETFITKNVEADARLEVACRSGLERALALLREDRQQTEIDSQGDSWYKLFVDSELVESEFGKDEFLFDEATQEEASFDVKLFIEIQDESSKFNVYGLRSDDAAERRKRREKFAQLVDRFRDAWGEWDLSVVDGELIAEHLLEFIDRTEDRPYRNVPVPSTKGLGGINDIGELLYLEPITPEILWDQRTEDGEAMIPGLYRFLTVWSDMQININTAPHATLSTLFEPQFVYLAERIVDFRERADEERERDLSRF